jgi:predicted metal-binding membrane protein
MANAGDHQAQVAFPAGAMRLTRVLAQPRALAVLCVLVLAALGWLYLGLTLGAVIRSGEGGALYAALCRPTFGNANLAAAWIGADFALVTLMWAAMTFAMMLPTAGPMVLTYAEIAETAAARDERVASPMVLTAGYVAVWLGFAAAAALLQETLTRAAWLDPALGAASPLFAGAIFIGAGAYQFSALKHACLTRCQRPFPFFFANWGSEPAAVFRLGLRQGLYCLGCCWAMMLVMFAVGVMNVAWMAGLGIVMAAEKLATTTRLSRAIGVAFMAIGVVFVAASAAAHWPGRAG